MSHTSVRIIHVRVEGVQRGFLGEETKITDGIGYGKTYRCRTCDERLGPFLCVYVQIGMALT